jgi:hypothetical protein
MSKPVISAIVCTLLSIYAVSHGNTVSAAPRFTDNGDGTITDNKLGLIWAKADNRNDIDWEQAEDWTKHNFAKSIKSKYEDWRLPTIDELSSLYSTSTKYKGYTADCGMVVKIVPEIKISCILLWSSETALGVHLAFNFNIGDSFIIPAYDISGCRALPVRSLK